MKTSQEKLLHALTAYVPKYVVRQIQDDPTAPLVGRADQLTAAVLFADVSGFTPMSESLARLGKAGAEELTRVLNEYFSTMIDLVRGYGGVIIKFGGDAMTVMFADAANTGGEVTSVALVKTACACGLAMQKRMSGFSAVQTAGGEFSLRMKIGISAGKVLFVNVGDAARGLEYVLAGHALDRMAEAEHHATAGEVVLDSLCVQNLSEITWSETREDFRVVVAVQNAPSAIATRGDELAGLSPDQQKAMCEKLVPFIPPAIYQRLLSGQQRFVGEHRRVTSLFVSFTGLDYENDSAVSVKLQRYFTAMQQIINRYEGRLNRVITGDKGNLLHIIFGAPVKHEDDEQRAVHCALKMQQQIKERFDLKFIDTQKIGVASGSVFAGNVGSEKRYEYTVMGDVVNLSARLMQAAPKNEIMLDPSTYERVKRDFVCEELTPIRVKGKSEPIAVCLAKDTKATEKSWASDALHQRYKTPMVGRAGEIAQIKEILEKTSAGRGHLLAIKGEAGVGKSRLLEEVVILGFERQWQIWGGNCFSYGTQSPYLPWIDLFHAFFNWLPDGNETVEERGAKIAERLSAIDPEFAVWAPIIGQMLGLPLPDNDLTASLDAQLRKQRVFDLTLNLLRDQARRGPFILVFEDVHWIDSISLELLNYVARNIADYPILLVAIYRPTIELGEWERYDYHHLIELVDLPAADAVELVRYKLGGGEVPDVLRERILRGEERVNPFFVEEMVNTLIDTGYLVPRPDDKGYIPIGDWTTIELPDSVQSLVMSRIDRLGEPSKLTIKVAAVLGRVFKYAILYAVYPVEISSEQLHKNLEALSELDLTPLDRPAPDWEYIFKHVTTQEVAYESLLYSQRRDLHYRVGAYFEYAYHDNLEEQYETLARHYSASGNAEKGFTYLVKAGDKAKNQFANAEAIDYYTRALDTNISEETKIYVDEALGDVYRLIGQYAKAAQRYQHTIELGMTDAAHSAELNRKTAETYRLRGHFDQALQYLELARKQLTAELSRDETKENIICAAMSRLYNSMAWVYLSRGEHSKALQHCKDGLDTASKFAVTEAPQILGAMIELELTMGVVYWRTGEYAQAIKYLQQCADRQKQTGDLPGMVRTYNNLAGVHWNQQEFDRAEEYMKRSLELSQRIGNTYAIAMCYNNLGVIHYHADKAYQKAIDYYENSLQIRREIGDMLGMAQTYDNLGETYQALENYQRAVAFHQQAARIFTEIGDKNIYQTYRHLATATLALKHSRQALVYANRLLTLANEMTDRETEGIATRLLGQAYYLEEQLDVAEQHLRASIATFTEIDDKLELARSLYALSELASIGDSEKETARQRAIALFKETGATEELEKLMREA